MIVQTTFMPEERSERENLLEASLKQIQPYNERSWAIRKTFGASNSILPLPVEDRIFFGGPNLDNFPGRGYEGLIIATVVRFATGTELYVAFYIHSDIKIFEERLETMLRLGNSGHKDYAKSNNNSRFIYYLKDKRFYLFNASAWEKISIDTADNTGPSFTVDKVVYSLYPPGKPTFQSLSAGEFIHFLKGELGEEKVQEITVWERSKAIITDKMQRTPSSVSLNEINSSVRAHHLTFSDNLIARLHAALNFLEQKHFVILTGLSGTGKTGLAIAYGHSIHGITNRQEYDPLMFIVPVRPEWTDPTGLTGYYDVLSGKYVVPPFLEAIFTALAHPGSPVYVCLDELNLARVEYYFSDILSAIETRQPVHLHSYHIPLDGTTDLPVPPSVVVPPNLYILGTINIDETTNPLSEKVLDRAVLIDTSIVNLEDLFALLKEEEPRLKPSIDSTASILEIIHGLLTPHQLQFGYRVAEEFVRYHHFYTSDIGLDSKEAIDEQMIQKILVKLRGDYRHSDLLADLKKIFEQNELSRSSRLITQMQDQLADLGSFQYSR